MESERTPRFWELARRVVSEAQRHGLVVPGFRSPPRLPGAVRTVRRHPGGALVAVAWKGRSPTEVVADMVDGLVLVNGLAGAEATACRQQLWAGLGPSVGSPSATAAPAAGVPTADAGVLAAAPAAARVPAALVPTAAGAVVAAGLPARGVAGVRAVASAGAAAG